MGHDIRELASLINEGRYAEVERSAEQITGQFPDNGFAWKALAVALHLQNRTPEARIAMEKAVELAPQDAEAHFNLASILQKLGHREEAVTHSRRALQLRPEHADGHYNLGVMLHDLGQRDEAINCYRTALRLNPDFARAYLNLGSTLQECGQWDEAETCYRMALALREDYAQAYTNLGTVLKKRGNLAEAEANQRKALEINPVLAESHTNLGNTLRARGHLEEAEECYRTAIAITPASADAHANLATLLRDRGRLEEAAKSYETALLLKPDCTDVRLNRAILLLALGHYREGWESYESRLNPDRADGMVYIKPDAPYAQWSGENLHGKSILVWKEQGLGDEIQFIRYLPLLKARGATSVTLVCMPELCELFRDMPGLDRVLAFSVNMPLPPHDYWTFLLSLPLRFQTTVETIPARVPYLKASPEKVALWGTRLPAGHRVGLIWKGSTRHTNDANRSLPGLATLAPLWSVPKITFISLQKGQGEDEAANPPPGQPLLDVVRMIEDFSDTAAIITQLDLVITVDTSAAHLAGALGTPCWLLLPAIGSDWRWLRDREDSPWYPGVMRLFRQKRHGGWDELIGRVRNRLAEMP